MSNKLRVGINGFGRIGRLLFRSGFDRLEIVGINNASGSAKDLAHLLKYDSTHGIWPHDVSGEGDNLVVDGQKMPLSFYRDPSKIPWKNWGVDMVLECTGVFRDKESNQKHLDGGAKRVMVSAPAKVDGTFVYGINHESYDPAVHTIVSNASCTTNCLAPLAQSIDQAFGIESALMTTVHSYTNDQRILDSGHKDLRRARAAATSMIPTTTGAASAVGQVLPQLEGKLHGMAIRVPTPNVSLVDFNAVVRKSTTVAEVNQALIKASEGALQGVLYCSDEPLVSIDLNGHPGSSIVDLASTAMVGDRMIKVLSWYDNEVGFSCRMVDFALHMFRQGL